MQGFKSIPWRNLGLAALIFALAYGLLGGQNPERFHIDEAHKISETYYFQLLFGAGEWRHADWDADFYARVNPPPVKYLQGGLLALYGIRQTDRRLQTQFESLWRDPVALKKEIPPRTLAAARQISALLAAAACVWLFCVGCQLSGPLAGCVSAGVCMAHPLFLENCSLALTEPFLLCFLLLVVTVQIVFLRRCAATAAGSSDRPRLSVGTRLVWGGLLPAGAILFSAGTKLSGGVAGVLWFAGCLATAAYCRKQLNAQQVRTLLASGCLAPALALGLFIVGNPHLYQETPTRLVDMLRIYREWYLKLSIEPGEEITTTGRLLAEFYTHAGLSAQARFLPLSVKFPFCWLVWAAVLGLLSLGWKALQDRQAAQRDPTPLAGLCAVVIYGMGLLAWIPLDWDRYFLPIAIVLSILAGEGGALWVNMLRGLLPGRSLVEGVPVATRRPGAAGVLIAVATAMALLASWRIDLGQIRSSELLYYGANPPALFDLYSNSVRLHPNDPVRLMHWAEFQDMIHNSPQAVQSAGRAVALLRAEAQQSARKCLLAAYLFKLAGFQARSGDPAAAAESVAEQVRLIEQVAQGLIRRDPYVLESLGALVQERLVQRDKLLQGAARGK